MDLLLKAVDAGITVGSSTLTALCCAASFTPVGAIFGVSYFALSTLGEACLKAYRGKPLRVHHFVLVRLTALIPALLITIGTAMLFGLAFSAPLLTLIAFAAFTAYLIFAIRECCQLCGGVAVDLAKERRLPLQTHI